MNWIVFILVGKLFIYLGQSIPLPQFLKRIKTIEYWHNCDLCFGVWVYALFSLVWGMDILKFIGFSYIPVVSEFVTGGVVSFAVHIWSIGWKDKFAPDIIL